MTSHWYRILLGGHPSDSLREAFEGLEIQQDDKTTALIGKLDQAALHGVLNRAHALGLEVIEAARIPT